MARDRNSCNSGASGICPPGRPKPPGIVAGGSNQSCHRQRQAAAKGAKIFFLPIIVDKPNG